MKNQGKAGINASRPDVRPEVPVRNGSRPAMRCPACGGRALVRIRRRMVDRLLSLFVGLRRYRCHEFQCAWEGNLRRRD